MSRATLQSRTLLQVAPSTVLGSMLVVVLMLAGSLVNPAYTAQSPDPPNDIEVLAQAAAAVYLPYAAHNHAPKDVQPRFSLVNQIGGPTWALAAAGDRLYRAEGPHVVVLDAGDPLALREIGRSEVLPGMVVGLAVSGNALFVAANDGVLYVMDVSGASDPRLLARLALPDWPRDVIVAGGLVYVAAGDAGVLVVDPGVAAQPRILGGFQPEGATVMVRHEEGYIYAVAIGGPAPSPEVAVHVHIIDVRDPSQPRRVATLNQDTLIVRRPVVVQGRLFVNSGHYISVYDLSRPASPVRLDDWSEVLTTLIDAHSGDRSLRLLEVIGTHLVVIVGDKLLIVPVAGPTPPTTTSVAELPGDSAALTLTDRLVYTVHPYGEVWSDPADFGTPVNHGALAVTDLRDPAQPRLLATYHSAPSAGELYRAGDILILAAEFPETLRPSPQSSTDGPADLSLPPRGPFAVDISDPARPRGRGFVAELAGLLDLVVDGNRGFGTFATRRDQRNEYNLVALDLTDPLAPRRLGSLDHSGFGIPIAMSASRIYRLVWEGVDRSAVEVVDATDPAHMHRLGKANLGPGAWTAISERDGFVYVLRRPSAGALPVVVLDLTDPAQPHPPVELPFPAIDMEIAGDKAYVISELADGVVLAIYDLFNPTAPRAISSTAVCPGLRLGAYTRSLLVTPENLVLIGGTHAVCAVDAADPARPRMLASTGLPAYARGYESHIARVGLAWAKDHAFVEYFGEDGAGGSGFLGLASLRLDR